jgi:hypothetical protein
MIDFFSSVWAEIGFTAVWQTTLALAVGLVAAAICTRRPARADGLLLASVLAALAAPIGTWAVRELGWGVLVPHSARTAREPVSVLRSPKPAAPMEPLDEAPKTTQFQMVDHPVAAGTLSPFAPRKDAPAESERRSRPNHLANWLTFVSPTLSALWLALSSAALARLGMAVWTGRELLRASRPVSDVRIERTVALAAGRLQLRAHVEARVSAQVRCPLIWCWSRRPIILLPEGFVDSTSRSAWPGIFCHELAHWKRRDHLSSLATDLLCCLAPWQPLAWWAAWRHAQLSELACDEWVLVSGESAENYADALLDLAPQRGAALALAVVRNRAGLVGRIRHILDVAQARPALGKRWTAAIAGSTLGLVALVALAQQQPPVKVSTATAAPNDEANAAQTVSARPSDQEHQVSGVVLNLADKPVAGVRVYWVGLVRNGSYNGELDLFAEGVTDEQGRFTMLARFDVETYNFPSVFARHPAYGLGLRSYGFDEGAQPIDVHMPDSTPLRGRILNANGMPVAGAEVLPVEVDSLIRQPKKAGTDGGDDAPTEGVREGSVRLPDAARSSGELPRYWPQSVKTDADGRFSIPGNDNAGSALLRITAEGFGLHGVAVTDDEAVAAWNKRKSDGDTTPPLANNFTLVLEPPREFEGIVTDAKTGRPVAGTELVLESWRNCGQFWNRQVARATSDAQGHYRFLVPATGREHHFRVYPPLGYAPLGAHLYLEKKFVELFGNGRVFHNDIPLTPGHVVRGRVIDADSRAPLPDAAVFYRSGKIVRNDYGFSEPVRTNDRGEFKITAVEGPGLITVETRSPDYIRAKLPPELAGEYLEFDAHAFAAIDAPAQGEIPSLELTVRRGVDLIVQPVGPDGQPVPVVQFAFREADVPPARGMRWDIMTTPLRLHGCGPGKTYRLVIGTRDCVLGAVADLVCDPASGPVKVVLQPTGGLRGRLVYADGTPASDVHAFLRFRDDAPPDISGAAAKAPDLITPNLPDYYMLRKDSRRTTDASGTFELLGIIPGVYPYLHLNYYFPSGERYQAAGVIESGKTLDMGEITVKP